MMRVIWVLVIKEFRQIFRQREMKMILFVMPLIQMFVFSFAVSTDLKDVRLAVYDGDRSADSRRLIESFLNSGYFIAAPTADHPGQLVQLLKSGKADVTVHIPPDFSRRLAQGRSASVAVLVDGSNSSSAARARAYAEAVIQREAFRRLELLPASAPMLAGRLHRIEPVSRFFYNPELESRYYMIPGIVALIVTVISAFLTGMAIVREKEIGTHEQLMVTPISPGQLIAGKTIPFLVLAYVELTLVTVLAVFTFKLPLIGSVGLLALAAFGYLLTTLGMGLLVSTISSTQQQAMFTVWFFLVFAVLMSGFFYPVENMPNWIELLTYLNPLRYFMAILRGIFLKGSQFTDLAGDFAGMMALGAALFGFAVFRFRKRTK